MANGHSERNGDAEIAGQRADPVAAQNEDLVQAGGPVAGEPAKGGDAYASGGQRGGGGAEPSGSRTDPSGPPASNAAAPRVHTAMDGDVRDTEEKARRTAAP
ncbi:hypothetical protein D3273_02290 [Lichenibacterium minor]|uniref:Uncharacterized protein n=1 Tax=Lichenibacterium minor TaxID=2316528 RepID=A0A4Q2U957_9HYPH|nr:hypothetical protein [Lichenibacterium minor]RYC33323.1 hypothetical protein D3273_02290 [Lichenibacterium minor]